MDPDPKERFAAPGLVSSLDASPVTLSAAATSVYPQTEPATSAWTPAAEVPGLSAPAGKEERDRHIVAVGGGKGGIGKSLVTSSLGIALAKHGRRVVVIDADLGGANLHTCLGLSTPERTLSDFIHRRVDSIEDVIIDTGLSNLGLISGAHDYLTASNLKYFQKTRLLNRISQIDADYVLLDIGAGIAFNIVDFFLLAEQGLLVVIPEPSSIENAYRFLKMSFYRHLWRSLKGRTVRKVVEQAMDQKNNEGIRTPFDLLEAVERFDASTGRYLKEEAKAFRPHLLVNQTRYAEDERLGDSMASVCRRHLGISIDCIGAVRFDDSVWRANRKKRPFMLDYPDSDAGKSLGEIALSLMGFPRAS